MKKQSQQLVVIKPIKPPANLKRLGAELIRAKTPEQVLDFERRVAGYEAYMRRAGFSQGDLHEINESRMRARWRLGQMLAAVVRSKGRPKKGVQAAPLFRATIKRLKLERSRAIEAQRIGHLPKIELEKIFQEARKIGELVTITWLVDAARPYWYKASRQAKHKDIAKAAAGQSGGAPSVYPLLYVDPPWRFQIYSEKGLERTPDQHYPTMSDEEIIDYIRPFAHDDAAMLMWCTSSNVDRAIVVLEESGFEFKSSAVWVKSAVPTDALTRFGMGLVFRNMHEILLYGTRGDMPGPQYQPSSVFFYPRGRHSAKPPEIRTEIERMYPDFNAQTRAELWSRDGVAGWTHIGYEAKAAA